MSTVAEDVQQIRKAIYGREVREAIADGIEHCYSDVSSGVTTANTAANAANAAAQRANTAAAGAEGIPGTASLEDVNNLKSALNNRIDFIAEDIPVSSSTDNYSIVNVNFDIKRKNYVTIKNTSQSSGYFRPAIYRDTTIVQAFPNRLLNPGEEYTWELIYLHEAGVRGGWVSNSGHYTDYTWSLYIKNTNRVSATMSLYAYEKDRCFIKPGNTIVVCKNVGDGSFNDIGFAIDYAKSVIDVNSVPVTILIEPGVYTISPVGNVRRAVLDKGANRISIKGENPYTTIIKMINDGSQNNQMINIGGDCSIENLTFLNLHTGSDRSYSQNPYCIHNDAPYDTDGEYTTMVNNCILYSELYPPIGAGLHDKQKQVYKNVTCIYNSDSDAEGAMYIHSQASVNDVPIGVEILECRMISENGSRCLTLPSVHSGDYLSIPVSIIKCLGWTSGSVGTYVSSENTKLSPDSDIEIFTCNANYAYPIVIP